MSVPDVAAVPSVVVDSVTYSYFEAPRPAVRDITLNLAKGERVLVIGHNGSGKSTLLGLIGGKHLAQKGGVTVLGRHAFDDTTLNADVTLVGPPWPPEAYFANTVENICSPALDLARRDGLATLFHMPLGRMVDKLSSGEKRRVQLIHGLMNPAKVYLLDECSTDLDIVERRNVLRFLHKESEETGAVCVYATHILDGTADWATRLVVMRDGCIVADEPRGSMSQRDLRDWAYRWLTKGEPIAFVPVPLAAAAPSSTAEVKTTGAAVATGLKFSTILENVSFSIPRGSRTLLLGSNGCGKSTLLDLIAGRRFFANPDRQLVACDKLCFQDSSSHQNIGFCGNWWPKAPEGQMTVAQLLQPPIDGRTEHIRGLLKVDFHWDLRFISAGELKRVQLLLALSAFKELVVLDEATSDLDFDMRHILLQFLFDESVQKGVTVVYATHIFDCLDGWATHMLVLDRASHSVAHGVTEVWPTEAIVTELIRLKEAEPFSLR